MGLAHCALADYPGGDFMAVKIKVYQMTVNNVGDREPVTVVNRCHKVEIRELPSISPKQFYMVSDVPSGGVAAEVYPATEFIFDAYPRGRFAPGETVGYVESETGTTTFQRIEYLDEP